MLGRLGSTHQDFVCWQVHSTVLGRLAILFLYSGAATQRGSWPPTPEIAIQSQSCLVLFRLAFDRYYFYYFSPVLGRLATVRHTPPAASSTWPTSSRGSASPPRHDMEALHAHAYARSGMLASISARVAALTQTQ